MYLYMYIDAYIQLRIHRHLHLHIQKHSNRHRDIDTTIEIYIHRDPHNISTYIFWLIYTCICFNTRYEGLSKGCIEFSSGSYEGFVKVL